MLELPGKTEIAAATVLALLTGNVSRGAQLKLEHYGVWHFSTRRFADDHQDRNRLILRSGAQKRHGGEFSVEDRRDRRHAARHRRGAFGARTISVATGTWTREQLAEHQPILIDDLPMWIVSSIRSDGRRLTIEGINGKSVLLPTQCHVKIAPMCCHRRRIDLHVSPNVSASLNMIIEKNRSSWLSIFPGTYIDSVAWSYLSKACRMKRMAALALAGLQENRAFNLRDLAA